VEATVIKATYYLQAPPLPSASITLTGSKGFGIYLSQLSKKLP